MNFSDEQEIIEEQDLKPSMVGERVCSGCKKSKPVSDFYIGTSYRVRQLKGDVIKQQKPCSECKKCMNARAMVWQKKNHERFKTYQALYHRKKRRQLRRQQKGL